MTIMAVIGITGSTDGIGRAAARVLLADGHRVLVHARSRERGEPVANALGGDVALLVGDLARIDDVGRLADQAREHGPIDAWVHNAGVWVRGSTPRTSADGHETTFAVNVLAPHLLTHLLSAELRGRLLWLGSGLAGSARPQPAALGRETDPVLQGAWLGILSGLPLGSQWGVDSRARTIESKDDMRKRRLPSPDRADTAAMLFSGRAQATLSRLAK
jgi:NAD(P)-dependent dehydrogenase (short-subunit alcohol dehydrogenase family)